MGCFGVRWYESGSRGTAEAVEDSDTMTNGFILRCVLGSRQKARMKVD